MIGNGICDVVWLYMDMKYVHISTIIKWLPRAVQFAERNGFMAIIYGNYRIPNSLI